MSGSNVNLRAIEAGIDLRVSTASSIYRVRMLLRILDRGK